MRFIEHLESSVRVYSRQYPCLFDRASGYQLFDTTGRSWIDFLCSAGALNYGHNPTELVEAVAQYLRDGGVISSLDLATSAKEAFLETLHDTILAPRNLKYVVQFTGPTGANAVEAALKLARLATGRRNIIAFTNGYHGLSLGALSTTGNKDKRSAAIVSLGDVIRIPYDGYLHSCDGLALLDRMLVDPSSGVDTPAAIIVETIQGEGGVNAASADWLRRLRALSHKHNVILIVDDIQAGCGRAGTFFSFEPSEITPDIVCLSKSLSGLGLPMSLLLIKREFDIWQPGQHNGTFRGNNLAFVAARRALDVYWRTPALMDMVATNTSWLDHTLDDTAIMYQHRGVQIRGRGYFRGLYFDDPTFTNAVVQTCFRHGLLCETCGPRNEVVKLLPPLTANHRGLADALSILCSSIRSVDQESPGGAILGRRVEALQ